MKEAEWFASPQSRALCTQKRVHSFGIRALTPPEGAGQWPTPAFPGPSFNTPYQPPHYLSAVYAHMLQWTRSQFTLHSLQFRLMSFWWDLGMVNHCPGPLILTSFHFRILHLITYLEHQQETVHPGHLVYSSIRIFLLSGVLAYSKTVSSSRIPLKTENIPYSWLAHMCVQWANYWINA